MDENVLNTIMDIGAELLRCGGEVYRTEEALLRMSGAYGAVTADVFVVSTCIILAVVGTDGVSHAKMRRISGHAVDLDRLDSLNDLTRRMCRLRPPLREVRAELSDIHVRKTYSMSLKSILYFVIAGSFSLFFGGTFRDACVSGVLGMFLMTLLRLCTQIEINNIFSIILCSYCSGLLAVLSIGVGWGDNLDTIMIGDIMLIIPGLAFTNGIRDMLGGDFVSGLMRLIDASLLAVAVSAGFAFAARFSWHLI